jgi:hypothetical protein
MVGVMSLQESSLTLCSVPTLLAYVNKPNVLVKIIRTNILCDPDQQSGGEWGYIYVYGS